MIFGNQARKRIERMQSHLQVVQQPEQLSELKRQETRSVSEWASDLWNMVTKDVIMTERHGGDLVAEVLQAHGVKHIFCLSGGHISPILVSSENLGIRIIDVRHEVNAVFAADAVGRLSGVPGIAAVTAGPGVTNTVTAIQNCFMAQSPMILLGGAAATVMQGRGALQDIDHLAVLKPITKWCYSCRTARDIVPVLRRAFKEAVSGVPGPVFIELPLDTLYPVLEMLPQDGTHARLRARDLQSEKVDKQVISRVVVPTTCKHMSKQEYVNSRPSDSPVFVQLPNEEIKTDFVTRTVLSLLKTRLYAGAFEKYDNMGPLPIDIPTASDNEVSRAAAVLAKSKKPLCIIGSQCMLFGEAGAEDVVRAIESLGIPCFLGGMARGLLGRNHPLHIRQNRGLSLKQCDAVFLFGVVADFRLDYGRSLPKVPIVTVNRSKNDLSLNAGIFWKAALSIQGDACNFMTRLGKYYLSQQMPIHGEWAPWAEGLKEMERKKESATRTKSREPAMGQGKKDGMELINPLYLCQELDDILPDDSVLVADGGDFVAVASYIVRPRGPLRWLDPGAFGTLGVGGGFALGAKLVRPDAEVWLIWGDGSAGYSLLEFDTFTRHKIPIVALVGNDACWTQIAREQVPMFQSNAACALDYLNYHVSAEGLGGAGIEIASTENIKEKLQLAQEISKEECKPVLVNAHIGKTNFREGSLSV